MAIEFRGVDFPPLRNLTVSAPDSAVIGVVGRHGAGKTALLRLAAGLEKPAAGSVIFEGARLYLGTCGAFSATNIGLLALDQTLAQLDALEREKWLVMIDHLRSHRCTVFIVSHQADLLRRLCDEVWWLEHGTLAARGDPGEVLDAYQEDIAQHFRAWGETHSSPMRLALRRGDGRAEIQSLETLGENEQPSVVWRSSESVAVRVRVRYRNAVEDPVIGIMIRTRIGLNVYGTNTELEQRKTGKFAPGEGLEALFRFRCDLCPGEYTLTAASHDPDGTAHDWIDNAVAFVVTDSRYTAGVANLRASVETQKLPA